MENNNIAINNGGRTSTLVLTDLFLCAVRLDGGYAFGAYKLINGWDL